MNYIINRIDPGPNDLVEVVYCSLPVDNCSIDELIRVLTEARDSIIVGNKHLNPRNIHYRQSLEHEIVFWRDTSKVLSRELNTR